MDVISSSTNLSSDLNSADTTGEVLETSADSNTISVKSSSQDQESQNDVNSSPAAEVNSVENVKSAENDTRTVQNAQEESTVDSENVIEPENDKFDVSNNSKESVECAISSVSDSSNICELSKLDNTEDTPQNAPDTQEPTPETNFNEICEPQNEEKQTNDVTDGNTTETQTNEQQESPECKPDKPIASPKMSEQIQSSETETDLPEASNITSTINDSEEQKPEEEKPVEENLEKNPKDDKPEENKFEEHKLEADKPEEEKSEENKPEEEKSSEDKPAEEGKYIKDKPEEKEKSIEDKPEEKEKSIEDKSAEEEKSIEDKPAEEEKSIENKPAEEKSVEDKPAEEEKSGEDKPEEGEKSSGDKPEENKETEKESAVESKTPEESSPSPSSSKEKSSSEVITIDDKEDNQNSVEKAMSVTETDNEETNQPTDALSVDDDQSMDRDLQQENPVFVHVETKNDATNEGDKTSNTDIDMQNETGDEIMEVTCLTEEDPIGINQETETEKDDLMDFTEETSDKDSIKVVDFNDETITSDKSAIDDDLVSSKGADEELCIIPDTDREISQEEKDAATAAAAAQKDDAATTDSPVTSVVQTEETVVNSTEKTTNSTETSTQASSPDDEFLATVNNISEDAADKPEIKVTEISEKDAVDQTCHQCCMVKKCLYKVDNQEKATFICSETCLISFRTLNKPPIEGLKPPLEGLKIKDLTKKIPSADANKTYVRKCSECIEKIIQNDEKILSWETMDFCNEDCLSRYQNRIGSHCANCKKTVLMSSLGKYCVRFGHDIRQFCCSICLEEFKKGLKVCSYCQKDISGGTEGFLAPVGDKGQFKDFCSQLCMEKYDQMSNKNSNNKFANSTLPVEITHCAVCNNEKQVQVLFDQVTKRQKFCSSPCFVAFKFVNQIDPLQCDMCKNYFENDNCTKFSIFYDNIVKNFCCKTCQNIYIIANRRIVPCSWCKVKKYNFDMIKKACNNGQVLMMCSLNCLSLFQVSVNAVSSKKMRCDYCTKVSQAQYHLTMSDATIRNFCTYHCVMSFQGQFSKLPITLGAGEKSVPKPVPVPASGPKKYSNRGNRVNAGSETVPVNEVRMPVITSVESLANNGPASLPRTNLVSNAVKMNNQQNIQSITQPAPAPKPEIKQQIIVKAPPLPAMKNAATSCRPILHTKGVSCRPHPCTKETQTEEIKEKTVLIPVPVPIYVPVPLHMYSAPVPVPIPFPLPIPVPVFIPTTRNSAAGIMKEIKKIQVKIPTDPFEAELLMMAEMVAGEKKVDNTDSESEEDDTGADAGADGSFSPDEQVDTSNTFGDDMLQMALKIATELDEPAVDLEGALTANTITASQNQENASVVGTEETVDDPQPMHQLIDRQNISIRGRKRPNRQPRNLNNPAKRGRRMSSHSDLPMMPPPQPSQPAEPIEKPDANMCLKYTFGVNAWKQWVTTKNAELEKSSRRVKLFKNEILQLTADELNYSLCLFVKEVRKPNGTEYAPDTIYYLCLGIQQYLFENGRIDNIFTDAYYEKFTDCLDEVARKFSVLYNDSHYIVTRVEEEHLWESKQLGAHSPHVLLSTLMFFNTKHFNLTTVDEHMQLSFSHIMKHWKRNPNQPGAAKIPGSRNVLLRFYPPQTTLDSNSRKKKVYEQQENEENPLRCPVKLYEFYLSKCPESVKTRNDVFYLLPERSCVPDSPVWYSTMALGREALEKMLHRVKMVKEINVALLTS